MQSAGSDLGLDLVADLSAEYEALASALVNLDEQRWRTQTAFREWSVFDHVGHLCVSERTALAAVTEPQAFAKQAETDMKSGLPAPDWKGVVIPALGAHSGADLLRLWHDAAGRLATALASLPQGTRIGWYGPSMSSTSFASARLMETWAHGETIHDALRLPRPATSRLRHICELGWRTRGFALKIHRLPPDDTPIRLELRAPGNELWTWGATDAPDRIIGSAREFARVVCQCRNVRDTRLAVVGAAAAQWMAIAQCFVGGASRPPAPGLRMTPDDQEEPM